MTLWTSNLSALKWSVRIWQLTYEGINSMHLDANDLTWGLKLGQEYYEQNGSR